MRSRKLRSTEFFSSLLESKRHKSLRPPHVIPVPFTQGRYQGPLLDVHAIGVTRGSHGRQDHDAQPIAECETSSEIHQHTTRVRGVPDPAVSSLFNDRLTRCYSDVACEIESEHAPAMAAQPCAEQQNREAQHKPYFLAPD